MSSLVMKTHTNTTDATNTTAARLQKVVSVFGRDCLGNFNCVTTENGLFTRNIYDEDGKWLHHESGKRGLLKMVAGQRFVRFFV